MTILNFMLGWRKKIVRVSIFSGITSLLIGVFFVFISAQAGALGEDEITSADIALLEFLGEWGTEEGEWIDPLLFDDAASGLEQVVKDEAITSDVGKDEEMKRDKTREMTKNPKEGEGRK